MTKPALPEIRAEALELRRGVENQRRKSGEYADDLPCAPMPTRLRVLDALNGQQTAAQLGEALGMNPYSVARSLCELHVRGLVHQVGAVSGRQGKSGFKRMVWERTPMRRGLDIRPLMEAWQMPVAFPPVVAGTPRTIRGVLHVELDGSGERHCVKRGRIA